MSLFVHSKSLVILRSASENDVDLLYRWANDPVVREASFSSEGIEYSAHCEWFSRKLNSPDCRMFIGLVEKDPFGIVRVERAGREAQVSISVAREFRGLGLSMELLKKGIELVRNERFVETICAEIKGENAGSIRLFEKSGFQRVFKHPEEEFNEKARVYQLKL